MLPKGVISYLLVLLVIMAAIATAAAYGPNSQFRRDRRAIHARTTATGEDHIAHASIKMRMMNEGRSQRALNPVRAKRFINPASGAHVNKVSESFLGLSGNRFPPVFPGRGRAAELVDEIQHGYVQPPREPFPKDAVYKDLLTRQRKDGQHPSRSSAEKPSQMKDEVDEFLQFMHEMGILGKPEDEVFKGSKQQDNTDEKPPSAAAFVNHHIHRPSQNADDDIAMREQSSRFGGKAESHQSSAVVHPLPRPPNRDVSEVKRQSFIPNFSEETEKEEQEEREVVALQEEAIINIPPQKLAKSDIGNHGLAGVDLGIIRQLLEEILARKTQGSNNM